MKICSHLTWKWSSLTKVFHFLTLSLGHVFAQCMLNYLVIWLYNNYWFCWQTLPFLFLNCRLELEVEPIFASMALYDGKVKKKVYFTISKKNYVHLFHQTLILVLIKEVREKLSGWSGFHEMHWADLISSDTWKRSSINNYFSKLFYLLCW